MLKSVILTFFLIGLTFTVALAANDNADNANYADGWNDNTNPPADNGGSGFQAWINLENTGNGGKFITDTRQVDGMDSFAITPGNLANAGVAEGRELAMPITAGTYDVIARFDIDNATAFSGFNLKSASGSQFGSDGLELIAFGLVPASGNNAIAVFGDTNSTIDLGHDLRGNIIQFSLVFDTTQSSSFTLTATDLTNPATGSTSGTLKFAGNPVTVLGFGRFNTGTDQTLVFDNIHIETVPEPSSWAFICIGGSFLALHLFSRAGSTTKSD